MEAALVGLMARSTASGWLLCIIGVVGVIALLKILAAQRPKMRELDMSEDESIRTYLSSEMASLREEIKGLRDENKSLRDEVRQLHGVIDGMRREGLSGQISAQRVVADALPKSPEIERALTSLGNIKGDARL